ncbi:hypothetical protein MJO29_013636 [Puccinia striiformis f. sp. tritici]|nr:hypothetical protein MJO29_013636 [Puccinia striiformis f. sp. tritici]
MEYSSKLQRGTEDVYDFCYWAGRVLNEPTEHDVSSSTLTKYIFGLQAWHLLHLKKYPDSSKQAVGILPRSSAHADAKLLAKPKKGAIHLSHLVLLAQTLANGNPFQKALFDLALVTFWGMARISELTYNTPRGPLRKTSSVLVSDLMFERVTNAVVATLAVRRAKTCIPGGIQFLALRSFPNMLCPVRALQRRLNKAKDQEASLFGYYDTDGTRIHLTKMVVCHALSAIWTANGCTGISGHSFRVGGASFKNAIKTPIKDIRLLGRWTSDCYLLYLRQYSGKELEDALSLWDELNACWKRG